MKKIFLSSLITLFIVPAVWANIVGHREYQCPSVEAIKSLGLKKGSIYQDGDYYGFSQGGTYGSPYQWLFRIYKISASSKEDAFLKADATLIGLSGSPAAEYRNGFMYCLYHNENGYITDAFTKNIG